MIPRPEHPNPQFFRENWLNLNGEWDFAFDFGNSGKARGLAEGKGFDRKILVPFCPESKLSGIEYKDFINAVWYKRTFSVTEQQVRERVLIHFGAVDFETEVFINGRSVGTHKGGYTSFCFDITEYLKAGENEVIVYVQDLMPRNRSGLQGVGKQCGEYYSKGCSYTRTTGIWQTVYLEFVPKDYIESFRIYPDIENSCITVKGLVCGAGTVTLEAFYEGEQVGTVSKTCTDSFTAELSLSQLHLWELGKGRLYDLILTFNRDKVKSYFGMRSVGLGKREFLLNGKSVFQRLVLDQGFYPDGIYTAQTEEELVRDIHLSLAAGFNGARLHEKVFEPLFLYHCDKLGYMVWGEYPNWGLDVSQPESFLTVLPEWMEALKRDFNHPAIIGWCPLNETWDAKNGTQQDNRVLEQLYYMTKYYDETRPCIDTSGNYHTITDIFDLHDYDGNVEEFKSHYADFESKGTFYNRFADRHTYGGQPVFISEYGGIGLAAQISKNDDSKTIAWSYGQGAQSIQEYIDRYRGLTDVLLDNKCINGFCYTQLYDVEQEQNGIYTYEREPKLDIEIIRKINSRKAAIES